MNEYDFPTSGINYFVIRFINSLPDLSGKTVVDVPCGDGRSSYLFKKKGATVLPFDLYPEFFKVEGLKAEYADMDDGLPVDDLSVDYILCQEGIEHIPNQFKLLCEFNRILKPGGVLYLTTPSMSHMRARLSNFLLESELWKRMPASEVDSIWFSDKQTDRVYFGHLFLRGVQHLNALSRVAGFNIQSCIRTDIGSTSVFLTILFYPLLALVTLLTNFSYRKKNKNVSKEERQLRHWEQVKLNLSWKTLCCKHIFWALEKKTNVAEHVEFLKEMQQQGKYTQTGNQNSSS